MDNQRETVFCSRPANNRHSLCIRPTNWWRPREEECLLQARAVYRKEISNAIGCKFDGKSKRNRGQGLKSLRGQGGRPAYTGEEVRSDWKTAQHSTFLIANRDGPSRGLNGRLLHKCAWDRHVDDSGGTPKTSLIPNSEQLQRQPTEKSSLLKAAGRCCATDRNTTYG